MKDFAERGAVLCRHCHNASTEPRAGDGIATLRWWLGVDTAGAVRWLASFLGVSNGDHTPIAKRPMERHLTLDEPITPSPRFEMQAEVLRRNLKPEALEHCAALLGVSSDSLSRLGVGWSPSHQATSWPMRDADGHVVGIRLRSPETARKWAVTGSRAGLIYDSHAMHEARSMSRLWIVEGPTDTAALVSLDLDAVGVPSAGGSRVILSAFAKRMRPDELVIVADADDAGQRGAERLREALILVAPVRLIAPPDGIKDARQWVTSGADRASIEAAADAFPVMRLQWHGGAS
jgi:hypothetical protein